MPRLDAIDTSHWNNVTSWDAVKSAGVIGVIAKATEGTTYKDDKYIASMKGAQAAGLRWAAYHFLKHGHAAAQMAYFLKFAGLPQGSRVAIDYEDAACTLADLHEAVRAIQKIDPTLQIAVYAGSLLKEQLGSKRDALLAECALWLAQYTSGTPSWPTGTWATWSLWQYSDGNAGGSPKSVTGVDPPVDCNTFNGSPENCLAWFGPASVSPPAPPPPKPPVATMVDVVVAAPDGIEVRVAVNGRVLA